MPTLDFSCFHWGSIGDGCMGAQTHTNSAPPWPPGPSFPFLSQDLLRPLEPAWPADRCSLRVRGSKCPCQPPTTNPASSPAEGHPARHSLCLWEAQRHRAPLTVIFVACPHCGPSSACLIPPSHPSSFLGNRPDESLFPWVLDLVPGLHWEELKWRKMTERVWQVGWPAFTGDTLLFPLIQSLLLKYLRNNAVS